MSKNKCKKNAISKKSFRDVLCPFSFALLQPGEIARVLSEHPYTLDELTKVNGMIVISDVDKDDIPNSSYEFCIDINQPCRDVVLVVEGLFDMLSENRWGRIFRDTKVNTFLIATDLDWDAILALLGNISNRYGLAPML